MIKTSTLSTLLDNSERTIQRWRKDERPIISLLQKYFTEDELTEFLNTGKIFRKDIDYNFESTLFLLGNKFINYLYTLDFKLLKIILHDVNHNYNLVSVFNHFLDIYDNQYLTPFIPILNEINENPIFLNYLIDLKELDYLPLLLVLKNNQDLDICRFMNIDKDKLSEILNCFINLNIQNEVDKYCVSKDGYITIPLF